MRSVNPNRLERWLGVEAVNQMVHDMKDWYGPQPIPVAGVPGEVYAIKGDFVGHCQVGEFASVYDKARDMVRRLQLKARITANPQRRNMLNVGWTSLATLRQDGMNGGKRREFPFFYADPGSTAANSARGISQWNQSVTGTGYPSSGTAASAAAAGRNPTGGTDGGFYVGSAPTGMNFYFTGAQLQCTQGAAAVLAGGNLLLYDRLFDVAKTMNSTSTEAVSGTLTRYTTTSSPSNPASAAGNFLFVEVMTALANTAHNWTVCTYTSDTNAGQTLPLVTGLAQAGVMVLDHQATATWFCPLVAGDTGILKLTQMQCSALVATGTINFVIGHPIAWMPTPAAQLTCEIGGITSAFNMARVFDSSCLSFINPNCGATRTSYNGSFTLMTA